MDNDDEKEPIPEYIVIRDKPKGKTYKFATDITVGQLMKLGSQPGYADKKNPTKEEKMGRYGYKCTLLCMFSLEPKLVKDMPKEENVLGKKYEVVSELPSLIFDKAVLKVNALYRRQQNSFLPKKPTNVDSKTPNSSSA